MAFSVLKKTPGFTRAHIEPMRGSPEDSLKYCSKEDKAPFEKGTMPRSGKRKELTAAVEAIKGGSTMRELALGDETAVSVVKFSKGLTTLRSLCAAPRDPTRPPTVYWLHGSTGTGKTRAATEFATYMFGAEFADPYWLSCGSLRWFDGYDGQPVAILDDFRAKQLPGAGGFSFFLRLLDRYPMAVEFKGGFVNWAPQIIIITCPKCPESCFSTRNEHVPEDIRQLLRRITYVFPLLPDTGSNSSSAPILGEGDIPDTIPYSTSSSSDSDLSLESWERGLVAPKPQLSRQDACGDIHDL